MSYKKKRNLFLTENPNCQARLPGCTLKSTDVHHKKGRGKYLLDTSTWLSCCRKCHTWIELNPLMAKELGFSLNRTHDKNNKK